MGDLMADAKVILDAEKVEKLLGATVKKYLVAIGYMVEADAKRLCPVDTGRLRASISTNYTGSGFVVGKDEVKDPGGGLKIDFLGDRGIKGTTITAKKEFVVVVGTNVEYAPFIELGTKHISPRAFLRRAFEKHREKVMRLKV
jgi:HK97 gp10 family phage protein